MANTSEVGPYRLSELDKDTPEGIPVIWEGVQFHPSYAYEDFVRGLVTRPRQEGVVFEVEDRILARSAAAAGRHFHRYGANYTVLAYPYLFKPLNSLERGTHGGISFQELVTPFIKVEAF